MVPRAEGQSFAGVGRRGGSRRCPVLASDSTRPWFPHQKWPPGVGLKSALVHGYKGPCDLHRPRSAGRGTVTGLSKAPMALRAGLRRGAGVGWTRYTEFKFRTVSTQEAEIVFSVGREPL